MTNYLHEEAHKGLGHDCAGEAAVWRENTINTENLTDSIPGLNAILEML